MLDNTPRAPACDLADQMIAARFAGDYGVDTSAAYLNLLDRPAPRRTCPPRRRIVSTGQQASNAAMPS